MKSFSTKVFLKLEKMGRNFSVLAKNRRISLKKDEIRNENFSPMYRKSGFGSTPKVEPERVGQAAHKFAIGMVFPSFRYAPFRLLFGKTSKSRNGA